jgi:superfamily II DNA/RNA helicase
VLIETARAKTGSGKTAAYVLPVLQAIIQQKSVSLIGLLTIPKIC